LITVLIWLQQVLLNIILIHFTVLTWLQQIILLEIWRNHFLLNLSSFTTELIKFQFADRLQELSRQWVVVHSEDF
jgi:hypothetical protein